MGSPATPAPHQTYSQALLSRNPAPQERRVDYSRVLKVAGPGPAIQQIPVREPETVFIVSPVVQPDLITLRESSELTLDSLKSVINVRAEGWRVQRVRNTRRGGVLVALAGRVTIPTERLLAAGLRTEILGMRSPRLLIFDLPSDESPEDLTTGLYLDNFEDTWSQDSFVESFKIVGRQGPKGGRCVNVVAEVTPRLREAILTRDTLHYEWRSCKARDYNRVVRCFKCQAFGHLAAACQSKYEVCSYCTERGHGHKTCPATQAQLPPRCVNCVRARLPADHTAASAQCSVYRQRLEEARSRTDYG